jgi:hypothetical protein
MPIPENRSPSLASVIRKALDLAAAGINVSVPGRIQTFDPSTGLASVKPQIQDFYTDEDGNTIAVSVPVITSVPVQFPGAGGFRITFPVKAGDLCTLLFSDRSLAEWIDALGANEVTPIDVRRHSLTDAVALMGTGPGQWTVDPAQGTVGMDAGPQIQFSAAGIALDNGALPVARAGDPVAVDPALVTFCAGVVAACAANTPTIVVPPYVPGTGTVQGGAARVKA